MNHALRYKLRGLAYWAECANPFSGTVTARRLPLGLRIAGYKRDAVGRGLYRRGVHEEGLTRFLLETFGDGAARNFLDVGANIGYFSCLMAKLAGPPGKVVAIEAEPQNVLLLTRNLKNNGIGNVAVHACAVGAADGTARMGLYKAANRGRHSLVDLDNCKVFVDVPVRRLDDLLKESAPEVKSWALMKMDVEGYESFVIDGATQTLSRTEFLAMEYAPKYWNMACVNPADVFAKLSACFSRIFQWQQTRLVETTVEHCLRSQTTIDLLFRR